MTPPISASPTTRTLGAPGSPGPLARWSKPPMMPKPDTSTSTSSPTMMSTPPIRVKTSMVTSRWLNRASRRSSWTPPSTATTLCRGGTTHVPPRVGHRLRELIEQATAADVRELMKQIQDAVMAQFKVRLEPEVKMAGEW